MPQHGSAHKEMVIYADLMLWLKSTDLAVFHSLASVYTKNLSRLYVREVTEFLESAKQRLLSKEAKGKHSERNFVILCDCYFCVFIYLFFFWGGGRGESFHDCPGTHFGFKSIVLMVLVPTLLHPASSKAQIRFS